MKNFYPIINNPTRQGRLRRTVFAVITAAGWLAWFALWTPLWWCVQHCGHVWFGLAEQDQPVHLMHVERLGFIPVLCLVFLYGWARYNYQRFAHLTRRQSVPKPVETGEATQTLGIPGAVGETLQGARMGVVHFDSEGHPLTVDDLPVGDWARGPGKR